MIALFCLLKNLILNKGKYEALIEIETSVKVRRNGNKDFSREGNVLDTGFSVLISTMVEEEIAIAPLIVRKG